MDEQVKSVLESIEKLSEQCEQAWDETRAIDFPEEYSRAKNIVVCGMGGSALPTHVVVSLGVLKLPTVLVNDYHIPSWANNATLVFLSTYSGGTEETLSCAQEAKEKRCLVTGNTSGGKLTEFLRENNYPGYVFEPKNNPSGQPRIGIGYGLIGQLGILERAGLVEVGDKDVRDAIDLLRKNTEKIKSHARDFAGRVENRALVVFGAEHLVGNAHIFANQTNETAKTFSSWFAIPEANHHLLEGLKRPKIPATCVFVESEQYSDKTQKRFEITQEIVRQNEYPVESYTPGRGSKLSEALDVLMFSSFVTFDLAVRYGEDPTVIPWVDYFKEQLGK